MAKAAVARKEPVVRTALPPAREETIPGAEGLSARLRALLTRVRRPFMAFAEGFEALTTSRAQLAPEFMRAHATFQQEVGGSFVAFVRLIDPSVPEDREGYRNHRSYQAAEYLRRLVNQAEAIAERQRRRDAGEAPAPSPQTVALATVIATLLTLAPEADVQVWTMLEEIGLRPRQLSRLRELTSEAETINLEAPAPVAQQLRASVATSRRAAPTRTTEAAHA
jgi:hypothetical protein